MAEYKNNEPPFSLSNPDLSQTIFPLLEDRLGRKLSIEENSRFLYTSGMRKEWFYNALSKCETTEECEKLFTRSVLPTSEFFGWDKQPITPSFWGMLWDMIWK